MTFIKKRVKARLFAHATQYGLLIAAMAFFFSCTNVCFQAVNLDQPVLVNKETDLHKDSAIYTLSAVTTFNAKVSKSQAITGSPGYGGSTTTQNTVSQTNNAETKAVELIGGDDKKVITDMSFKANVAFVNLLIALFNGISLEGNGTVQDIGAQIKPEAEVKPEVKLEPKAEEQPKAATQTLLEDQSKLDEPPEVPMQLLPEEQSKAEEAVQLKGTAQPRPGSQMEME